MIIKPTGYSILFKYDFENKQWEYKKYSKHLTFGVPKLSNPVTLPSGVKDIVV